MNLVGRTGVFNNEDDGAWGKTYGGKKCTVLGYDDEETQAGLVVRFEDGQVLVITVEEFTEFVN